MTRNTTAQKIARRTGPYGRPDGGEIAPKAGTIKKIRLIAGGPAASG